MGIAAKAGTTRRGGCPYEEKTALSADCSGLDGVVAGCAACESEELRSVLYAARLDNPQASD
jgi:hypothetical protein